MAEAKIPGERVTLSLAFACLWFLVANVIAILPSKRNHWPQAYVLMTIGFPLLAFVVYENGIWIGLACLLAGGSVLRWPVIYLWRWIRRTVLGQGDPR